MSTPSTTSTGYYVDPGYWVDGYTVDLTSVGGLITPTTVQTTIPSYLYWQYADDQDLQAFVSAYNTMTQEYVNTFNQLNLPVYAGNPLLVGSLLDWAVAGIYGLYRPAIYSGIVHPQGPYNTVPYNKAVWPYLKNALVEPTVQYVTTDDIFKRILTWNLYRGDGKTFNAAWLKRHALRFLEGLDGVDPGIDQTYLISVTFGSNRTITLDVSAWALANPGSQMPQILQAAMQSQVLNVPFQYQFIVNVVPASSFTFQYQQWTTLPPPGLIVNVPEYKGWQRYFIPDTPMSHHKTQTDFQAGDRVRHRGFVAIRGNSNNGGHGAGIAMMGGIQL